MNNFLSNDITTLLSNDSASPEEKLNNLKPKDPNGLIFAHLNVTSVRNKFDLIADIVKNNIDILMISETKLDSSFPIEHLNGYSEPYRFDKNRNGGGVILFVHEVIPSKLIESKVRIEGFFVASNLTRKKCLLCCSNNPKYSQISHHVSEIAKILMFLQLTLPCLISVKFAT